MNGGILILGNGTLAVANFVETAGLTQLIGGNLTSEQPIQILGGAVAGFGTIQADLFNGGLVQPVSGDLVVNGDYLQSSDGVLEVTPTSSPNTNDLVVQGNADLDGLLYVPDLQLPPGANTVTDPVLTANTITDSFATTQLDASPDSASVVYNSGEVDVVVTAPAQPPPGLSTSPSPNPSRPGGPSGPTGSITPAQPPPSSAPGQGNPPSPLPSPASSSETAKVQASIAAARGVPPVGAANPGARVAAPPESSGQSGSLPPVSSPGGSRSPGRSATRNREFRVIDSSSTWARRSREQSAHRHAGRALFDRHGLDRFEDGADEDLVDAFTLAFDLAVYTGEDTSLGGRGRHRVVAGRRRSARFRGPAASAAGLSVAAVSATLLTDDDSPRQEETAVTDGLDQLLINPLWKVPVAVPDNLLPPETLPEGEAEGQVGRTVPWWQSLILAPVLCVGAVKTLFSPLAKDSKVRPGIPFPRPVQPQKASRRDAANPSGSPEA